MGDQRITLGELSFVERWVRSGKAYYAANLIATLGIAAVGSIFAIIGGRELAIIPVFALISVASLPAHARRAEKTQRSKEILDRYSPERSPRPLGL